MKEKERFTFDTSSMCFYDKRTNISINYNNYELLCNILNQQDKEIKKLEEDNDKYSYHYSEEYMKNNRKLEAENHQLKQQVEELKGKRLEFYNDDVRQTQVINGVHFDIEQLLVFSEHVEHEKNISADKDKQINQLKQQLHDLPKKIVKEIRDVAGEYWDFNICKECGNVPALNTLTTKDFDEILDIILKKYGGEDE